VAFTAFIMMVMFCSRLGSRTWCPSEGLQLWASSYVADELRAALYPNRDSIVFSSNLQRRTSQTSNTLVGQRRLHARQVEVIQTYSKELDRILSQTIRRLGAARTLSQCSGFSFGSGAPF
jgi:hypothetical protein